MMAVFLTCLVIGLGALAIQIFSGHDAGHDVGHDAGHDGPLMFLASIRFWAFALLAFGLVGSLLLFFGFAGVVTATVIAGLVGFSSGLFVTAALRRLQIQVTSSVASNREVVGRVGRVIVPPSAETRGKVRVSVRGRDVDYVARSVEPLEADDAVLVEDCEGNEVRVSRAPKELAP